VKAWYTDCRYTQVILMVLKRHGIMDGELMT